MAKNFPRILIAGGGTGGHLFPALAIAEEIRKLEPTAQVLFVGTRGKIEEHIVPQRGYPFRTIWISGFHRRLRLDNFLFPLKVVVSLVQSLFVIRQFRPHVAVGTGGYVCGPILYAASWLGVPVILHESNSYPGITTRMLARRAAKIFIAFDAARQWLPQASNVTVVGTPSRESLGAKTQADGKRAFELAQDKRTVLVLGGSLGAASINTAVLESLDGVLASGIQFIWQTGRSEYPRVSQAIVGKSVGWVGPFIDTMEHALAAADVVVCRAGATTLAELNRLGKPAILVPYPHAAADHQTQNARSLVEAGAALMIPDREISEKFKPVLCDLVNNKRRLEAMSQASLKLGRPLAGRVIASEVLALAG